MHVFWITSRAAGVVALLASSLAVALGLMMARRSRLPELRVTHEALSLATIGAIVVHALALLGDSFLKPSLADIAIPFVSGYQRLWTTTGIVAGWMLILLGLSYYFRARIGTARSSSLHRFTARAWARGVIRSVGGGTDAGAAWFPAAAAAAVVPAAALLAGRLTPAT